MKEVYPEIQRFGGEVLAISFARPKQVAAFLERYPLPFPAVSDPEMTAYRAFALGRTSWVTFFRPDVLLRYLGLIFRGWKPKKGDPADDLLQLGGDFILDGQRRLVYAYRSAQPTDRPAVAELLRILRAAVPSP